MKIEVQDGKYTFVKEPEYWRVQILRYGQPWHTIELGSRAIFALMHRVEELEKQVETLGCTADKNKNCCSC